MYRTIWVLLIAAFATLLASASETNIELPEVDPLDHPSGEIITAGSSTVFPLSERMAERWTDEGGAAPSIASIGSGAGFERFCVEGETDISNASRAIKDSEVESAKPLAARRLNSASALMRWRSPFRPRTTSSAMPRWKNLR